MEPIALHTNGTVTFRILSRSIMRPRWFIRVPALRRSQDFPFYRLNTVIAWMRLVRRVGIEPTVFTARVPNLQSGVIANQTYRRILCGVRYRNPILEPRELRIDQFHILSSRADKIGFVSCDCSLHSTVTQFKMTTRVPPPCSIWLEVTVMQFAHSLITQIVMRLSLVRHHQVIPISL